jgi:hypothetical protein
MSKSCSAAGNCRQHPPPHPPVVCSLQDALLVLAPQHALGQRQHLSLACRQQTL